MTLPGHREEPEHGRVPPIQCFMNARDALNRAFAYSGEYPGAAPYPFLTEALDWQRRGLEQLVQQCEQECEPSEKLRLLAIDPPYGPRAYEPDGVTVTQGKFCVREDGVVIFRSDYEGWPH